MNSYLLAGEVGSILFAIFSGVVLSMAITAYAKEPLRNKRLNKRWEMFAEMDARARQIQQQQQQQQKPKEVPVLLPKDLLSDLESADRTDENMKEAVSPRFSEERAPSLIWQQEVATQTMNNSFLLGAGAGTAQFQNQQLSSQFANQQMIRQSTILTQGFVSGFVRGL